MPYTRWASFHRIEVCLSEIIIFIISMSVFYLTIGLFCLFRSIIYRPGLRRHIYFLLIWVVSSCLCVNRACLLICVVILYSSSKISSDLLDILKRILQDFKKNVYLLVTVWIVAYYIYPCAKGYPFP